ncbi:flagellar hook-length control protein FliK [Burkholderia sp. 4701]|nr:flagellar hook-length control protein FliK [Burkholderia sp. 4701]MXN80486.1 flagellar hook-length control protein FliK [Burkholderia sp. 4812]
MPSLSLLGALIDTASSALKAGRKTATPDASAASDAAALPFAQTLQQSVASQGASAQSDASSSAAALPSATAGAPSSVAGGAKPSSPIDDKTRDDASAAVNPEAAALAAAAAVQAQLLARPDGTPAATDATAADALSRTGDAVSAAIASAANATKNAAQPAVSAEPASGRDALHAALEKLTGGAGAIAMPAAAGAAAAPQPAATSAAAQLTPKAAAFDKTLADAKGALAAPQAQAAQTPSTQAGLAANADAAAHVAQALAATKGTADPAQAALAAAAAAQSNAPVAPATPGVAAANANVLAPHVGTADWTDALSQKVVFLSNAHQQSAELTLNPPDLGPLQVVLRVADNHAHALFVSQHAQVRDAVEAALPKLRDAMEAGGLGLGSATVSDGGFAQQQQQNAQQSFAGGQSARRGNGAPSSGDATADVAQSAVSSGATASRTGLVDTFA